MAYNTQALITTTGDKPVPQYYNPTTDTYEVLQGSNGAGKFTITSIERKLAFSTTTPLAANAVYTSPTIDAINYKTCWGSSNSDQAGGWVVQHSDDGITWYSSTNTTTSANTLMLVAPTIVSRYVRFVHTNGATAQTTFHFSSYLAPL